MGMMLSAPAGNDILFDEALCEQGRNFNNKIWNAFRLVKGWKVEDRLNIKDEKLNETLKANEIATQWFEAKLKQTNEEVNDLFKKYRISEALMAVYKLFWDEFSSWYLEMVKPAYVNGEPQPIDQQTYDKTLEFFEILLKMLHPFMPFITEELWQHLYDRKPGESIMRVSLKLDAPSKADNELAAQIENVKQIVSGVRMVRNQKNIAPKEQLDLQVVGKNDYAAYDAVTIKMANLKGISVVAEKDATASASNERFVANAPEAVVALERKKQSDSEEKIAALKESISALKGQKN